MENKIALQELLQQLEVKHLSPEQVIDIIKLSEFVATYEALYLKLQKYRLVAPLTYARDYYDMIEDIQEHNTTMTTRIGDYIKFLVQTSQDHVSTN